METKNYRIEHIQPKFVKQEPYVGDDGIYVPLEPYANEYPGMYKLFMSKEIFVEAYNKWIKGDNNEAMD